LVYDTEEFDLYEGTYDCSELFNITGNYTEEEVEKLQCSAKDTSTSTVSKTRVRITSTS
jgi:hypothetical protein